MSLSRIRNLSVISSTSYTYRGRRRDSYAPIDRAEMQELRARMRTYDQAYIRTALMNLGYSVVILKLFDRRFQSSESGLACRLSPAHTTPVGLLFSVLGGNVILLYLRKRVC